MKSAQDEEDLELKNLGQFYATQGYYNVLGVNVTDGVIYIMRNGYSWFVTDAISVIVANPKVRKYLEADRFLSVKLKLNRDKDGFPVADMVIDDGNGNVLYKQHYDITDAKRELTLFYDDGVLMLSFEY